jgi:hypothetical protein
MEIGNFFWHGNFSLYEYECIKSFVKCGFKVKIWSYNVLDLPNGVELCDANKIIPEKNLYSYSQAEFKNSLAAFSDIFRFTLLNTEPGWWFDADCFCLKSSDQFTKLKEKVPYVMGYEPKNIIACGAIYFNDKSIIDDINKELYRRLKIHNNHVPKWGDYSVNLVTEVLNKKKIASLAQSQNKFYEIGYEELNKFVNPLYCEQSLNRTQNSYIVHIWNHMISDKINKNIMPPIGSFLEYLFKKN